MFFVRKLFGGVKAGANGVTDCSTESVIQIAAVQFSFRKAVILEINPSLTQVVCLTNCPWSASKNYNLEYLT